MSQRGKPLLEHLKPRLCSTHRRADPRTQLATLAGPHARPQSRADPRALHGNAAPTCVPSWSRARPPMPAVPFHATASRSRAAPAGLARDADAHRTVGLAIAPRRFNQRLALRSHARGPQLTLALARLVARSALEPVPPSEPGKCGGDLAGACCAGGTDVRVQSASHGARALHTRLGDRDGALRA